MSTRQNFIGSILVTLLMCVSAAFSQTQPAAGPEGATPAKGPRKTAIFVKNRAKEIPDDKVMVLEDLVIGRITDMGFSIISREDVINAVSAFAKEGANKGDRNVIGNALDEKLSDNSSALALARNMNADYILSASITTYGVDHKTLNRGGRQLDTYRAKMVLTYKFLTTEDGGSITSDVAEASADYFQTPDFKNNPDMINDLLNQGSVVLADFIKQKVDKGTMDVAVVKPGFVKFEVFCGMSDLNVPQITKDEKGEYQIAANQYRVNNLPVTVALDGVVIGTTEMGNLEAHPGLAKIRLSRDGFKDWEQTINIRQGLKLSVEMQMTEAGKNRWREVTELINKMTRDAKIDDAERKVLEGQAKMLEQSGYLINQKSDIKVNTTQPIQPQINVQKNF